MPSIHLPYVNIALDAFALVVTLIILVACMSEFSHKEIGAKHFLLLQFSVVVALIADIIAWSGEGQASLSVMTLVANAVASCACQIAILSFMGYLIASLYANCRVATCILNIFQVLCVLSLLFCIGNAFFGYEGHYTHSENGMLGFVYLIFPIFSFFAVILLTFFAKSSAKINRVAFFVYTLFPVAGVIIDYSFHGISLTYAGFTVSILVIYTSIYIKKQN